MPFLFCLLRSGRCLSTEAWLIPRNCSTHDELAHLHIPTTPIAMAPKTLNVGAPPTPDTQGSRPADTPGMLAPTTPARPPATPTSIATPGRPRIRTGAGVNKGRGRSARSGRRAPPLSRREREPDLEAIFNADKIEAHVPGDLEYERAVASSNLLYRFSRPTYVLRPSDTSQVRTIVREAVHRKIPITIKNGGHSYSGSSFPSDGIMLDLQNMNKVTFDKYVPEACPTGCQTQHLP